VAGGRDGRAELTGRALLSSGAELDSDAAMVKVAKMVLELAIEESLLISTFVGVATHPTLNEIEWEKVCSFMDLHKLASYIVGVKYTRLAASPLEEKR
jgi:hypothetical protein